MWWKILRPKDPRRPRKKDKYRLFFWDTDLTITKYFKAERNPYTLDIEVYLKECVLPALVDSFLQINPALNNRFTVRWVWEDDWILITKGRQLIYRKKMDQGYPEEFIGGVGYWELWVDKVFTGIKFKTIWNSDEGTFDCTMNHDRLRQIGLDYVEKVEPIPDFKYTVPKGKTLGIESVTKSEIQIRLEKDLELGLLSMKYKKKDIDYEKVERVCETYKDETTPTEHAYNEIIGKTIMDYMKIKVPGA